jgi:hypothetical protein
MVGSKIYCINDQHRPNDIPLSKWIKVGQIYTIRQVDTITIQNKMLAFKLEEIDIDDCFPYTHFAADRFVPIIPITPEQLEEILDKLEEEAV